MDVTESEHNIWARDMVLVHQLNTKRLQPDLRRILNQLDRVLQSIMDHHILDIQLEGWEQDKETHKTIEKLSNVAIIENSWIESEGKYIDSFKKIAEQFLLKRNIPLDQFRKKAEKFSRIERRWINREIRLRRSFDQLINKLEESKLTPNIKGDLRNLRTRIDAYLRYLRFELKKGINWSPNRIISLIGANKPNFKQIVNGLSELQRKVLVPLLAAFLQLYELTQKLKRLSDEHSVSTIKKNINDLLRHLKPLYYEEYVEQGKVQTEVIPKRENEVTKITKEVELRKYEENRGLIMQLDALLKEKLGPEKFDEIEAQTQQIRGSINRIYELIGELENNIYSNEKYAQLRQLLITMFNQIIAQVNMLGFIDSLLHQLDTETYSIEEHLIRELEIRHKYKDHFKHGSINPIKAQSYRIYILNRAQLERFIVENKTNIRGLDKTELILVGKLNEEKTKEFEITETKRVEIFKKFLEAVKNGEEGGIHIFHKNSSVYTVKKALKRLGISESNFGEYFLKGKYVLLRDISGTFSFKGETEFDYAIMNFLIFHKNKEYTLEDTLHSISQPFLLNVEERLAFFNYKLAWGVTMKTIITLIDRSIVEGDMPGRIGTFLKGFMQKGMSEISDIQKAVAEAESAGKKHNMHLINFIKRPLIVHQLMITIVRLAIFSEGRAIVNSKGNMIYSGRESGYEGGNTIALHSHNNFIKYREIVRLVRPYLSHIEGLMDAAEHFKGWLLMTFHDIGTLDRQNSLDFSTEESKYGKLFIKNGHQLIGSWYIKENKLIRKLFEEDIKKSLVKEHQHVNIIAEVSMHHDNKDLLLDLDALSRLNNPRLMKEYVLKTCCAIADHSAGIGCIVKNKVDIDAWLEKGSTVFEVGDNAKYFVTLLKLVENKEMGLISEGDLEEMISEIREKMKEEIQKAIQNNELDRSLGQKLWNNLNRLNAFAAESVEGVVNAGIIHFVKYDGTTLFIKIYFDKIIEEVLSKKLKPEHASKRLEKFLAEFNKSFNKNKEPIIVKVRAKKTLEILNLDPEKLKPLPNSVGLHVEFVSKKDLTQFCLNVKESIEFLKKLEQSA